MTKVKIIGQQSKEGLERRHGEDVCWCWQSKNQSWAVLHLLLLSVVDWVYSRQLWLNSLTSLPTPSGLWLSLYPKNISDTLLKSPEIANMLTIHQSFVNKILPLFYSKFTNWLDRRNFPPKWFHIFSPILNIHISFMFPHFSTMYLLLYWNVIVSSLCV